MEIDKDIFNQNLLLTQAYCDLQMQKPIENLAEILRSFNPVYNGQPLFSFGKGNYNQHIWNDTSWSTDPWEYKYERLFQEQLHYKTTAVGQTNTGINYNGRILLAEVDQTVTDGASESCSDGFIDVYDCPPIDTWIYMTKLDGFTVIIAWVPQQFEESVQVAIDVNCMDCLSWYDDDNFLKRQKVAEQKKKYRPLPITPTQPERRSIWGNIIRFFKI